ncbi:MAG: hypothetical protein ACP5I2_06410 [Fervidicoccaceae archaeon]
MGLSEGMTMRGKAKDHWAVYYASILGVAYVFFGAVELFLGARGLLSAEGSASFWGAPADVLGGFASLVIGASYLSSLEMLRGKYESMGFILVGAILSSVFGILYLLIVLADGIEASLSALSGGEWTWDWLTTGSAGTGVLRPEIWLFLASLPLALFVLKKVRGRTFTP